MSRLSPARAMALDVISKADSRDAYASILIDKIVHASNASQADKDFAELLIYGIVSTRGTLDEFIDRNLSSPNDIKTNVREALCVSAYELLFLKKAAHAVVDQGVELVRSVAPKAARLANAVLRKMSVDAKGFPWGDVDSDDAALARSFGFPVWLAELLIDELGRESAKTFMEASNQQAPIFIACNYLKSKPDEIIEALNAEGADASLYDERFTGCIVAGNPKAAVGCKVLQDGRALVADASAQRAALIATPMAGRRFLEVGGGRGTKTILLQSHALRVNGEQSQFFSLDMHEFKRDVLEKRAAKFGIDNIELLVGDATALDGIDGMPPSFGKAIIDAPCSGLGTLRRHPEIRWKTSRETIGSLAEIGLAMLDSVSRYIEPGGSLVFSTCTVAKREDEDVIGAFLDSEAGKDFRISPIDGESFYKNRLVPKGPDSHFIAKLDKLI